MDTTELQTRLALLDHLLPSQREWTERLLFQLAFNDVAHIEAVGSAGSGKSTLALTLAELFSEQYNVAMLNAQVSEAQVAGRLMQQWFGLAAQAETALTEQIAAQSITLPLLLIIDDAEQFSTDLFRQLQDLPCLIFSFTTKPLLYAGLTLTINPPTSADAEQLLESEQLNPLELTRRLADANGNLHLLQQPVVQTRADAVKPEHPKPAMPPFKVVYIALGIVLAAILLYFFWPKAKAPETAVRIPVQTPVAVVVPEVSPAQDTVVTEYVDEPEQLSVLPEPELQPVVAEDKNDIITDTGTAPEPIEPEHTVTDIDKAATAEAFAYDEAELLAMGKQQVALQLAVLSSEAALQRFKRAYPQLNSLVYQRSWQGKVQLVLLLAPFSNADAAKQQLAQLPEALRATGPFVKRLQAVQAEINALQRNQQVVPE